MEIKTAICFLLLSLFAHADDDIPCSNQNPCPFTGGDKLVFPEQIVSENGQLDWTMTMDIMEQKFEWLKLQRRSYNYQLPAPTIRVKRGDKFNFKVVNAMSDGNQKTGPLNGYRLPNTSNIHLHGLHVNPNEPEDFVLLEIKPGEDYTYHYQFDQELSAGSYWYHPHVHGSVHFQVESGMAGFFIVEDDDHLFTPDHIREVSCPDHCEHEIQLLFQPLLIFNKFFTIQHDIQDNPDYMLDQIQTTAGVSLEQYLAENVHIMTTNGQIWPEVDIPTGQTKRFRMLNASGKQTLALRIVNSKGNDAGSCRILEIADDGVYFKKGRRQHFGHTIMSSGRRSEWLVNCKKPGTYQLRSVPLESFMSTGVVEYYDGLLLTINVYGMEVDSNTIPAALPALPWYYEDLVDAKPEDIEGRFTIELSGDHLLNRELFSGVRYRHRAKVGTLQEWTITNAGHKVSHPMHIHVNAFQVISYNPYNGPYAMAESFDRVEETVLFSQSHEQCAKQYSGFSGRKYTAPDSSDVLRYLGHDERWIKGEGEDAAGYVYGNPYRDTILVPPLSNITIRFRQHRFEGPIVTHCHVLYHEDVGMMLVTDSVAEDKYTDADVYPDSEGIFPGQCGECDAFYPYHDIDLPSHCS